MGQLENIPKKEFFRVPDGYFDKLPAKIQARIETSKPDHGFQPALRLALLWAIPPVLVAAALFFYFGPRPDTESMLASVETADLIQYLQGADMTTEEVLTIVDLSAEELESFENEVYDLDVSDADYDLLELELKTF
jgi:hypothetical protein